MLVALVLALMLGQETPAPSRVFGCGGPFTADLTEQRLIEIYGAANVRPGDVYVGEGFSEPGAVVFPDSPSDRIEVVWSDEKQRARPRFVRVKEKNSQWRTADGISVGSELKSIERINGRPFRLSGFGWDGSGTVMSWTGGHLERRETAACRLRVALTPSGEEGPSPVSRQVIGAREFSSGHPAMQQLNPRVYQLVLMFDQRSKGPAGGAIMRR